MAKPLTPKTVENLKPDPAKRTERPDPGLSGLYIVVQPGGAKSWAYRFRYGGKPCKLTLGAWPLLGVADARAAANDAAAQVERGINPTVEKKTGRAAQLEAQLSDRDKIKTLVADFDKRHLRRLKSGAQALQFLQRC